LNPPIPPGWNPPDGLGDGAPGINNILGTESNTDDPEKKAKRKQMLQKYNSMTDAEQQVVKQKYQKEMQKKQQEEQEKEMKKQQEAQKSQQIQAPSSPKRGAAGQGGSRKQKASLQLENDRKTLGNAKGAH